jgi:hypothetical protein
MTPMRIDRQDRLGHHDHSLLTTFTSHLEAVSCKALFGIVRHFDARPWEDAAAPLPLTTEDCPLKSAAHGEGQCVHSCLLRESHTSRVGWPTQ